MHRTLFRTVCLAVTLLTATWLQPAFAGSKIKVMNNLDTGIKGIYCSDDPQTVGKQIIGPIAAKGTLNVNAKGIPDATGCSRLYAVLDNGASWQFYFDIPLNESGTITFAWNKTATSAQDHYPSMILKSEGEVYPAPAGLAFAKLVKAMINHNLTKTEWDKYAVPGVDKITDPGQYVVSFGSMSWSLTSNAG